MQNKECTHGSINISHSSNWCQLCALTVILSNPFHMYYLCTPAFTVSLISFEYLEPQFAGRQNCRMKHPCTHSFATLPFCVIKIKHSCRFQCLESTSSIKTFFPPSCPPQLMSVCVCVPWQTDWSTQNSCESHQENAVFCGQKEISGKKQD